MKKKKLFLFVEFKIFSRSKGQFFEIFKVFFQNGEGEEKFRQSICLNEQIKFYFNIFFLKFQLVQGQ